MIIFKLRFVFMVLIIYFFLLRENEPVLNMHEFRKFPQRGSKVQGGLGGGGQL